jgi:Phosphoenolpyruvate phosphomutase
MTILNFGTQQPAPQSRATTHLRQMLQSGTMVAAPFVLNAFHAQIAASLGFQAVYMTGFGTAAERGYPDVGLVTQTEMVQNARYIASAVDTCRCCAMRIRATAMPSTSHARCASMKQQVLPAVTSRIRCSPRSAAFSRASWSSPWTSTCRKSVPPSPPGATRTLSSSLAPMPSRSMAGTTPSAAAVPTALPVLTWCSSMASRPSTTCTRTPGSCGMFPSSTTACYCPSPRWSTWASKR